MSWSQALETTRLLRPFKITDGTLWRGCHAEEVGAASDDSAQQTPSMGDPLQR
jgi:hypothetical protein